MSLPASGAISINAINVELGRSGTASFQINGAAERALAGRASGTISIDDFHGKSNFSSPLWIGIGKAGATQPISSLGYARDSSGNIYFAGYDQTVYTSVIVKFNSAGTVQWQKTLSSSLGSGSSYGIVAWGPRVNAAGTHIYLSGYHFAPTKSQEGYVLKMSTADGSITWQKTISSGGTVAGKNDDGLYRMVIDSSENVYLGGFSYGTSSGVSNAWINKLDSSGNLLWKKQIINNSARNYAIEDITLDSSGTYLYAVGYLNTGGTPEQQGIMFKIQTSNGAIVWAKQAYDSHHYRVAVDTDGYIYTGGATGSSVGYWNLYSKWDNSGNLVWQRYSIDGGAGNPRAMSLDGQGNLYASAPTSSYSTYYRFNTTTGGVDWLRQIKGVYPTGTTNGSSGFRFENGVLQYDAYVAISSGGTYFMRLLGAKTPTSSTGTFAMTIDSKPYSFNYTDPGWNVYNTLTSTTTYTNSVLSTYTVDDAPNHTIATGPGLVSNSSYITVIV